jgi:RsiW-degrading membrane proteinase PrsW (M82 family)
MNPIAYIALCFLPLGLWFFFAVSSGTVRFLTAGLSVFSGFCALLSVALTQWLLSCLPPVPEGAVSSLLSVFIGTALIEEAFKLMMVRFVPGGRLPPVPARTTLSVAMIVALTFAGFENIVYLLRSPSMLVFRLLTAAPLHAAATLLCAVFLLRNRQKRSAGWGVFLLAVFLHGFYNLCVQTGGSWLFAGLIDLLFLVSYAFVLWIKANSGEV